MTPEMADQSATAELQEEVFDPVKEWRLGVLLDAGYSVELAWQIAGSGADLHVAVELVEQGCTPQLAAQILL
jgi:hypothetical protein